MKLQALTVVLLMLFTHINLSAQAKWQRSQSKDDSAPIARHEAAFVVVKNRFYLLGGRGIKPTSIYDTASKTWILGAAPPIELHHFQPVVIGTKIYIIGAMTGKYPSETPVARIQIYDTVKDSWEGGDEIPADRLRGSTGNMYHKGYVYVACGIKNGHIGDHKNWLDRYDPKTNTWEILADAPRARDHFQLAMANGKLYAVAGRLSMAPKNTFSETIAQVDRYDIQTNTWETLAEPLPTPRAGNMAIGYKDEIVVIGGESGIQKTAHAEVEALHSIKNTWRTLDSLQQGRHGTGVLQYVDSFFVASGCGNRGGKPELDTMERYILPQK